MGFSKDQYTALREKGFVNLGQVLESTELERIAAEYDRLVVAEKQMLGNERDGRFPYRAMLNFRSDALRGFITHPALVGLGIDYLGPDVRFWWDQGINKPPGAGSHIDWHQDNGYHRGGLPEYLTLWLALDDSDTENGGLLVLPGSHTQGKRDHELAGGVHWVIPEIDESDAVPLDAKAGDLLAFSSLLVHKTVGNHTQDRHRRAWVIQYVRADIRDAIHGTTFEDRPWVAREGRILEEMFAERPFDLKANGRNQA